MKNNIKADLEKLQEVGVIDAEVAQRIGDYYQSQKSSSNKILIVFGVLGSLLMGLGVILLIAHNWDDLTKSSKTVYALLPLILAQCVTFYSYIKKKDHWIEGACTFLFFSTIASIALVSQIYNIPGNFSQFMLVITLLNLPFAYLLKSKMSAILSLITLTVYGGSHGYDSYPDQIPYVYFGVLLLYIPHFMQMLKNNPTSNFTRFSTWTFLVSLVICFGTLFVQIEELFLIGYMLLFLIFGQLAHHKYFKSDKLLANPFKVIGVVGYLGILLASTYDWYWNEINGEQFFDNYTWIYLIVLLVIWGFIHFKEKLQNRYNFILGVSFLLAVVFAKVDPIISIVISNLAVLFAGIYHVIEGNKRNQIGIMNFGLSLIVMLIFLKYFDWDISFMLKGIMFLVVGVGFFTANYLFVTSNKKKDNE